ncbi:predicted protein [Postia placenta Mad-698-R]|nr:predicted protein [Postia placenta Mad-698-R]
MWRTSRAQSFGRPGRRCRPGRLLRQQRGHRSLDPDLDGGKLGEDGGSPSSCISIKKTEGNLDFQLEEREGRVDCPVDEQLRDEAVAFDHRLPVISEQEDRRSFSVSLLGTAAGEDIIGDEGDEGLPADGGNCCDCPPGGLREERVLERPRSGDGGWEMRVPGEAGRDGARVTWQDVDLEVPVYQTPFIGSDGPWSAIRARLPITDEERSSVSAAVWVVTRDVDLLLGVEGVLKSRAVEEFVSHGDGGRKGSMQQEPKPHVREDKYRPLKCRYRKVCSLSGGDVS